MGNKNIKKAKNLQSEETMLRILKQAMRLFLEKGYHGTSIEDITQAAGLTRGALYWHFESKEDLLKKIIEEFDKRFLEGLIHAVGEVKGGVLDKFEKMLRYNAAFAYYNRELCVSFTTLAVEFIGAHHRIETKFRHIYEKYQNFLSDLILQGQKEKVFNKGIKPDLTALAIMAFHDGILLHWSMNRGKIDERAFVEKYRNIILNGLLAH